MKSFVHAAAVAGLVGLVACASLSDVPPPSNLVDAGAAQSQASALALYNGAIYAFSLGYAGRSALSYASVSGLFADELTTNLNGLYAAKEAHTGTATDENVGPYLLLNGARRSADEAIKSLLVNGGTLPTSYVGELHALKGYVYLMLSELYCEGVPFSTLATTGMVAYGTPETLVEMNTHAIAQFDSVAAYAPDSARIRQLAAIGKGRAYLNLGDFVNAKVAVAAVPTSFVYALTYSANTYTNYVAAIMGVPNMWMSDREGTNGLDYTSTPDVRMLRTIVNGRPFPAKFLPAGTSIPLANGVEARLIEAEAALHDHDVTGWATTLNGLRTSGGATPIAALTADSTTAAADTLRVNVMFRERAFWLYGTGHRQGDMRRLIRQYGRPPERVYSVGILDLSPSPSILYVPSAVLEIPQAEADQNPNYHGCLNHEA